jgi:diguanylate cyclase (GGDEF)-like protein
VRRHIRDWLLLGVLWLGGLAAALGQAGPGDTRTASGLQLLKLSNPHGVVSLDGRARYWIDDTGQWTADQVEAAGESLPWTLRQAGRQYRLDRKALWVQFEAMSTRDSRWYLELGSSGVDRAQLFFRDPAGKWVEQEAGDSKPVSAWPLPGRVPTFELAPYVFRPVRYLLRVEHAQVDFAAPMNLAGQAALLAAREREQFLLGAYFGLAGLICVVAAANAVAFRDRSFGAYALYVGMLGIGQAAYLGVGAQHLWDSWLRWNAITPYLLPGLSSVAALWFVKVVTEPARFSRALDHAVWGLIAAVLAAVAADTFLNTRESLLLVMCLTLLLLGVITGLILLVWIRGNDPHIRLIALGFLPVLVMAVFPVARGLNLIPHSPLTRYGVAIGAVLEMPILFYALSLRGSRRRESQLRAQALAHHDALTGLAHNRSLLKRLDDALNRARSLRQSCALLGVTIANVDAIVNEFGRDALDRVLVVTASYLRRAITDVDLAARVGEHDFVLLLDGPTTAQAAISRAQQVVASGLRETDALPPGLAIKFHVAAALLPHQDLEAASTLRWVLEGTRSIAADARKLIRPLNF